MREEEFRTQQISYGPPFQRNENDKDLEVIENDEQILRREKLGTNDAKYVVGDRDTRMISGIQMSVVQVVAIAMVDQTV